MTMALIAITLEQRDFSPPLETIMLTRTLQSTLCPPPFTWVHLHGFVFLQKPFIFSGWTMNYTFHNFHTGRIWKTLKLWTCIHACSHRPYSEKSITTYYQTSRLSALIQAESYQITQRRPRRPECSSTGPSCY